MRASRRHLVAAAFWLGLAAYGVMLVRHASHVVAGSDPSGYYNAARLLARGVVTHPVPAPPEITPAKVQTFTPLGFAPRPDGTGIVPFYPPGLPLQIAAAAAISDWNTGPYYVSPISAVLLVLVVVLIVRRLASPSAAIVAGVATASCAVLIFQSLQLMSDVVAAFWCSLAVLAALDDRRVSSTLAGFALGVAVLVRPTSLLLLLPLVLLIPPRRYGYVVLGGLPCAVFLAIYNWAAFDSPFTSGYTEIGLLEGFHLRGFLSRAWHYLYWTATQVGPPALVMSVLSLFLPCAAWRVRASMFLWFISFFVLYSFYDPYTEWWYTRFLLPAYPGLIVGAFLVFEYWRRSRRTAVVIGAWAAAVVTIVISVHTTIELRLIPRGRAYQTTEYAVKWVQLHVPPRSMLISMEMSGSTLAYTTHFPVRWDLATPSEIEEYARRSAAVGRQIWTLFMTHEAPEAQKVLGTHAYRYIDLPEFTIFLFDHTATGFVDDFRDGTLSGWAYDPNAFDRPARVRITAESVAETRRNGPWRYAGLPRPDLAAAGATPSPNHAFQLSIHDLNLAPGTYRLTVEVMDEPSRRSRPLHSRAMTATVGN